MDQQDEKKMAGDYKTFDEYFKAIAPEVWKKQGWDNKMIYEWLNKTYDKVKK